MLSDQVCVELDLAAWEAAGCFLARGDWVDWKRTNRAIRWL